MANVFIYLLLILATDDRFEQCVGINIVTFFLSTYNQLLYGNVGAVEREHLIFDCYGLSLNRATLLHTHLNRITSDYYCRFRKIKMII